MTDSRRWKALRYVTWASLALLTVTWIVARVAAHQPVLPFVAGALAIILIFVVALRWWEYRLQRKHGISLGEQDRKEYRLAVRLKQPPSNEQVEEAVIFYVDHYVRREHPFLNTTALLVVCIGWLLVGGVSSIPASHPTGRYSVAAAAVLSSVLMIPFTWNEIRLSRALMAKYEAPVGPKRAHTLGAGNQP